jgi:hypothetical protein
MEHTWGRVCTRESLEATENGTYLGTGVYQREPGGYGEWNILVGTGQDEMAPSVVQWSEFLTKFQRSRVRFPTLPVGLERGPSS